MSSYNEKMAAENSELITELMDKFLRATQLIMTEVIEISENIKINHPKLINDDELKCKERENLELKEFLDKHKRNPNDEEIKEIIKMRFGDALEKLKQGYRMSHALRTGGYDWSEFFEKEDDEPTEECCARQVLTDETREKYRHIGLTDFIKHSYPYWDNIFDKDINFLINHFSSLLPNSEVSDKLNILFGNDGINSYISDDKLDVIWKLIHLCIKLAIKYIKYTGRKSFRNKTLLTNKEVEVQLDVNELISKWKVKI